MKTALPILPLLVVLLAACHNDRAASPVPSTPAPATTSNTHAAPPALHPWEPVDAAFQGCAGGCGVRGEDASAQLQPGARIGDTAYCPVSGVVFNVTDKSPHQLVHDHPVYFCCEACAQYFAAHTNEVLARR